MLLMKCILIRLTVSLSLSLSSKRRRRRRRLAESVSSTLLPLASNATLLPLLTLPLVMSTALPPVALLLLLLVVLRRGTQNCLPRWRRRLQSLIAPRP